MAEKTVCVSHQNEKKIKVIKWKVREKTTISVGKLILLYDFDEEKSSEQRKLKATSAGTITKIYAQEGAILSLGEPIFELKPCNHPTIMNDMCAECGADLRKEDLEAVASVPMVHSIPDLKVSIEQAQELGKADSERLLRDRKLVLLVDLDQTLIHTTNDNIPPNIKDVYHFQLYGPNSPWYHTRLRPGTHKFLKNVFQYFELHICTFGARNYAHQIAMFLDSEQKLFSNRILSRDECFDPTSKKANLNALFPCGDNLVCIIDDREDVWSHASNLIHVKPYHFFQHTGDINAPPGLDKHENDNLTGVDLNNIVKNKNNGVLPTKNTEVIENGDKDDEDVCDKEKSDEIDEEKSVIKEDDTQALTQINNIKSSSDLNNVESSLEVVPNDKNKSSSEDKNEDLATEKTSNMEGKTNSDELNTIIEEENLKNPEELGKNTTEKPNETIKQIDTTKDAPIKEFTEQNDKSKDMVEVEDADNYLLYLEDILKKIHQVFYDKYDKMESGDVPDLKQIIPMVRSEVLKGSKLCFSGLVPTHVKLEHSKAYQIAKSLGAIVTQDLEKDTTHLVAVRPGTAKVNSGKKKKGLKIVTPDWLWSCAERWEHTDERIFPLNSKGSKNRHPPPHCSSPEHSTSYPIHNNPALRKRTPSGRFMDTINPLMSFSSDDIADMDREVEDILDDSDSSEDEKPSEPTKEIPILDESSSSSTSSSGESLNNDYPHGYKRSHEKMNENYDDEANNSTEEDDLPSTKFRRGEDLDDIYLDQDSQDTENSLNCGDEMDDGEWNMMGAALEREFLSNE